MQTMHMAFDDMFEGTPDFTDFCQLPLVGILNSKQVNGSSVFSGNDTLRAFHKFLAEYVVDNLVVHEDVVFSYRKNCKVSDMAKLHAKSRYFYRTDIEDFFSSISRDLVMARLLASAGRMPFSDYGKNIARVCDLLTLDDRLPVGFSTSPGISNSCLYDFDVSFSRHYQRVGLVYSRYSDDIFVSGKDRASVSEASQLVTSLLQGIYGDDFRINNLKSRFSHIGTRVLILGMCILPNGTVSVNNKLKRKIETHLHYFQTDGLKFLDLVGGDFSKGVRVTRGLLSYIHSVDECYFKKLERKYGASLLENILRATPD